MGNSKGFKINSGSGSTLGGALIGISGSNNLGK